MSNEEVRVYLLDGICQCFALGAADLHALQPPKLRHTIGLQAWAIYIRHNHRRSIHPSS